MLHGEIDQFLPDISMEKNFLGLKKIAMTQLRRADEP